MAINVTRLTNGNTRNIDIDDINITNLINKTALLTNLYKYININIQNNETY